MNPYELLNVPYNATAEQIKAAFIQAAKAKHPELNPNDPYANDWFYWIVEAYNILSDPSSRYELDMRLSEGKRSEAYRSEDFPHNEAYKKITAEEVKYIISEIHRQSESAKESARSYALTGLAWLVGGLVVTGVTLFIGAGLITWGAIVFGGYEAIKGFVSCIGMNRKLSGIEKEIWDDYLARPYA